MGSDRLQDLQLLIAGSRWISMPIDDALTHRAFISPIVATSAVTLPKTVLNALRLTKEWLDIDEAYRILLGHDIGYTDDGESQGMFALYPGTQALQ